MTTSAVTGDRPARNRATANRATAAATTAIVGCLLVAGAPAATGTPRQEQCHAVQLPLGWRAYPAPDQGWTFVATSYPDRPHPTRVLFSLSHGQGSAADPAPMLLRSFDGCTWTNVWPVGLDDAQSQSDHQVLGVTSFGNGGGIAVLFLAGTSLRVAVSDRLGDPGSWRLRGDGFGDWRPTPGGSLLASGNTLYAYVSGIWLPDATDPGVPPSVADGEDPGNTQRLWRSTDAGRTWTLVSRSFKPLAVNPAHPGEIWGVGTIHHPNGTAPPMDWAGLGENDTISLARSTNGGRNFHLVTAPAIYANINDLTISPNGAASFWNQSTDESGAADTLVWRSTNGGKSWQSLPPLPKKVHITGLAGATNRSLYVRAASECTMTAGGTCSSRPDAAYSISFARPLWTKLTREVDHSTSYSGAWLGTGPQRALWVLRGVDVVHSRSTTRTYTIARWTGRVR